MAKHDLERNIGTTRRPILDLIQRRVARDLHTPRYYSDRRGIPFECELVTLNYISRNGYYCHTSGVSAENA